MRAKTTSEEFETLRKVQNAELKQLFHKTSGYWLQAAWDWNETPRDIEHEMQVIYRNFMERSILKFDSNFPRVINIHLDNPSIHLKCHLQFVIDKDGKCMLENRESMKREW